MKEARERLKKGGLASLLTHETTENMKEGPRKVDPRS